MKLIKNITPKIATMPAGVWLDAFAGVYLLRLFRISKHFIYFILTNDIRHYYEVQHYYYMKTFYKTKKR